MKKTLSVLVLVGLIGVLLVPIVASATTIPTPETCKMSREIVLDDFTCDAEEEIDLGGAKSICCILNTLYNVTDWVFVVLVAVAAIFVIIGALTILTSAGVPEKVTSGRNYIMYAAIGLVVAFLAKAVPSIVAVAFGV